MSNVENLPRYVDKEEKNGCVARNLREMLEACNLSFLFTLDSHSKQAGDECHLLHAVSFFYATDLTFSEHVHRFISPARVRHAVSNEKKPIPSLTSRLMKRWSRSTRLLRYLLCRNSQGSGMIPSAFSSLKAFG